MRFRNRNPKGDKRSMTGTYSSNFLILAYNKAKRMSFCPLYMECILNKQIKGRSYQKHRIIDYSTTMVQKIKI